MGLYTLKIQLAAPKKNGGPWHRHQVWNRRTHRSCTLTKGRWAAAGAGILWCQNRKEHEQTGSGNRKIPTLDNKSDFLKMLKICPVICVIPTENWWFRLGFIFGSSPSGSSGSLAFLIQVFGVRFPALLNYACLVLCMCFPFWYKCVLLYIYM